MFERLCLPEDSYCLARGAYDTDMLLEKKSQIVFPKNILQTVGHCESPL